jgi:hypothetical protein
MSILLTFNGSNYIIPEPNEVGWGSNLDAFFTAIPAGCLQKTGGSFTLSAETDFGGAFGLKALYYKSRATNPSTTGIVRLGNTENVSWRDAGNTADLPLSVNASNQLTFNGTQISLNSFTPSRAIVSDGSGLLSVSSVTSTEVSYLSGVTGAIQTQLGGKVNDTGDTLTGALLFPDGTAGAPSISFSVDPDTGFYHVNANEIRIAAGGVLQGIIGPLGYSMTVGAFSATDGSPTTPSITFGSDLDTGFYHVNANEIRISAGGAIQGIIGPLGYNMAVGVFAAPDGAVGTPAYTFGSDTNTGMYRIGADDIGLAAAGALRLEITSSANYSQNSFLPGADNTQVCGNASFRWASVDAVKFFVSDGSSGFPTITFENDTDTGFYRPSANAVGITLGGTDYYQCQASRLIPTVDNNNKLGDTTFRWTAVYAVNGTIQTSMASTKTNITLLDENDPAVICKVPQPATFNRPGENAENVRLGWIADSLPAEAHPIKEDGTRDMENIYTDSILAMHSLALRRDYERFAKNEAEILLLKEQIAQLTKAISK